MSRPLYWPQTGQTRCGSRGELQFGQCEMLGEEILCCDRRLFVRECDCRCLGTAMATQECSGEPLYSNFSSPSFAQRGSGADSWWCSGPAWFRFSPQIPQSPLQ